MMPALVAACLLPAAAAQARFLPPRVIDGPSPAIVSFQDLALAGDGTGAAVYLKQVSGLPALHTSRLSAGAWGQPELISGGAPGSVSTGRVAVAEGGGAAAVFSAGVGVGVRQVWGLAAAPGSPWSAPVLIGTTAAGAAPALTVNRAGVAYAVWAAPGGGGSDVRAARFDGTAWTVLDGALDADPAREAGGPSGPPVVGVDRGGNAVVAWAEPDAGGVVRVFARRLTGTTPQAAIQASAAAHEGRPLTAAADQPDIAVSSDGAALIVYRQRENSTGEPALGGRTRPLGTKLAADGLKLRDAQILDDARFGAPKGDSAEPRVVVNSRGFGIYSNVRDEAGARLAFGGLHREFYERAARLSSGAIDAPIPVPTISENGSGLVSWARGATAGRELVAVRLAGSTIGTTEHRLTDAGAGQLEGEPAAGADDHGDLAVGFRQGSGDAARILVGGFDQPATAPRARGPRGWLRTTRVRISWTAAKDPRGIAGYRVVIAGKTRATAPAPATVGIRVAPGRRRFYVEVTDSAGQATRSPLQLLRIDTKPPRVRIEVIGRRRAKEPVLVRALARDDVSGVRDGSLRVSFGDATATRRRSSRHVYRRPGSYTIVARARDAAGNAVEARRAIRIAKPPKKKRKPRRRSR